MQILDYNKTDLELVYVDKETALKTKTNRSIYLGINENINLDTEIYDYDNLDLTTILTENIYDGSIKPRIRELRHILFPVLLIWEDFKNERKYAIVNRLRKPEAK